LVPSLFPSPPTNAHAEAAFTFVTLASLVVSLGFAIALLCHESTCCECGC